MKVFFVDPMGYGSLGSYDASIINNISEGDIFYYTNTGFDSKKLDRKAYKVYNYSNKNSIFKIISYIRSQFALLNQAKIESPDLFHFQWLKIPSFDIYILRTLKKRKIKIILTAHNVLPHDSGSKFFKIYSKIYHLVDGIVVHTSVTKEELISKFGVTPEKISIIPHGVLEMERSNQNNIDKIKSDFAQKNDFKNKVVFSVLGSINKYKGVALVIDAWRSLKLPPDSEMHLIIAGHGKFEQLKLLANDNNVTIVNRFLSNDEFIALIHLSDYVLLPYLQISQSGVLLTVLNEKKQIIVSKKGGLTEPFQFGKIGFILEDLTTVQLANTLRKAKGNHQNLPNEKTWDEIHNFYSWESIGIKTKKLYQKLIYPDMN